MPGPVRTTDRKALEFRFNLPCGLETVFCPGHQTAASVVKPGAGIASPDLQFPKLRPAVHQVAPAVILCQGQERQAGADVLPVLRGALVLDPDVNGGGDSGVGNSQALLLLLAELRRFVATFGLVIALAWKDAINATVAYLMPDNDTSTLYGIYVSAVGVTLLVTVLAWLVMRANRQIEDRLGLDGGEK